MPLLVEQPQFLSTEVTYTEPGIKGDTATNTMKPATIETGAKVKVPLFINTGDLIKVDIQKGIYVEELSHEFYYPRHSTFRSRSSRSQIIMEMV